MGWVAKLALAATIVSAAGCDTEEVAPEDGFRECTSRQWSMVRSADKLTEPVSCEFTEASWDSEDAFVVRVEHSRECEMVCTAGGCDEVAVCPSEIATVADDGQELRWISNVPRLSWEDDLGEQLAVSMGFDPVHVAGVELEKDAAFDIVDVDGDLCLQVWPAPPLMGSYTDCGDAMTDADLSFVPGILSFEQALSAAQPLDPPGEHWDRSSVALAFDTDDVSQSRWVLQARTVRVEVDMAGNAFRHTL